MTLPNGFQEYVTSLYERISTLIRVAGKTLQKGEIFVTLHFSDRVKAAKQVTKPMSSLITAQASIWGHGRLAVESVTVATKRAAVT
ncbi:hypothetical protein J6590_041882 [Homalodisca vitripennis]|nr:hypothetical protein J6590_041882 [Homalodisca vitripennis]